ncbi:Guanine nucleotide-binding protein-like 3 homolog [Coccomyxa sp. Obi]|nr:Guanine nucleotide-binding protein-like 3 homolog [Coccomyxa sp. Obi]
MPKKSKKSKSKRTTLKQKYKVIKKVKEHHKKKAKLLKKSGRKAKAPKDPGIPSQWPFKQELVKEIEWEKQRQIDEKKRKKEERRLQQAKVDGSHEDAEDMETGEGLTFEDVQQEAAAKQRAFESQQAKTSTSGNGGEKEGSRRAFYKEFVKVVEAADVVIEVLDARDPLSSRCSDVERYVRQSGASKKLILLLNKIDLVPREVAEAWLKYLREELPTVAFKCSTQRQAANLSQRRLPSAASAEGGFAGSECLGAETLLQLLKNYARASDIKTAITVGVVGLPNVGKSSLINSLKRARVAQTGNTPGVTKAVQQIHLDKTVTLLDSPGIVFSHAGGDAVAALRNCLKVEQLEDPVAAAAAVVGRCEARQLMALYKVPGFEGPDTLLRHIAAARGKLRKGGLPDIEAAARIMLHDWNDGRISYYTLPPKRDDHGHAAAAVVPAYSTDFNVDEVYAEQQRAVVASLPSVADGEFFETQPVGEADVNLEAMDADEAPREAQDSDEDADEDEGTAMSDGEEEAAMRLRSQTGKAAAAASSQAAKLYAEEGQFNPHEARAQRKQQKKTRRRTVSTAGRGSAASDEYDFAEAFHGVNVGSDED